MRKEKKLLKTFLEKLKKVFNSSGDVCNLCKGIKLLVYVLSYEKRLTLQFVVFFASQNVNSESRLQIDYKIARRMAPSVFCEASDVLVAVEDST
jgi:intergrase/recombinase